MTEKKTPRQPPRPRRPRGPYARKPVRFDTLSLATSREIIRAVQEREEKQKKSTRPRGRKGG